jgi:hypothetical protein
MTTNPLTVTHTVPLPIITIDAVLSTLGSKAGIRAVRVDHDGQRLSVTYDIDRIRFDDIERALIPAGAKPPGGPLNYMHRRWVRFTENNLLASTRAGSHTWYDPSPEDAVPHRLPERRHLDRPLAH